MSYLDWHWLLPFILWRTTYPFPISSWILQIIVIFPVCSYGEASTWVACISVWACWVRPVCLCGNYCDLNAGRAGESGCLLINEGSRWPCGGRELQRHSERGQVVSSTRRRTHKNTWAVNTGGRRERALCILLCLCCKVALCVCVSWLVWSRVVNRVCVCSWK